MTKILETKTNFTAGEVSSSILGRGDLRAYENGALKLRNLFIAPTGGVSRRYGTFYLATLPSRARLVAFEFNSDQVYVLAVQHLRTDIFADGVFIATLSTPWTESQIDQINWTQSADTLLVVHPDVPPKRITRQTGDIWAVSDWQWAIVNGIAREPFFKYAPASVTLTPSATTGSITLTASAAVFTSAYVNTRLKLGGKEILVTGYINQTNLSATVIETLAGVTALTDWAEQAFSAVRGYPVSAVFHQDRLVIGGSRDLPNRLWFSQSGDLFNFDLGTGLDDQAIEFSILSDQVNAIRNVFSGRHLQVFTSGAEWMVTGDPLTPANVQIKRQTRIGSRTDRNIRPLDVDGATLYIARTGSAVREFLYTDLEQAYQSTDLALLSPEIAENPIDQDYDPQNRLLYLVRADGKFATVTIYRSEQVIAWTLHETQGHVHSIAVVGRDVYVVCYRNNSFFLEQFSKDIFCDAGLSGEATTPQKIWSGLGHLEGLVATIRADGVPQLEQTVQDGQITLNSAALSVQVGLPYTHLIEPLPPSILSAAGSARATRLVEATFRLKDTPAFSVDLGQGARDVPLRNLGAGILDAEPNPYSGDVRVRALGWQHDMTAPLWRIAGSSPLPLTILSVNTEMKVN